MKSSQLAWTAVLIIGSIAAIGSGIRFVIAFNELLWLDELHTSWAVGGPFYEVASRAADGNQSPLFFWFTWIPVHLFGDSEFSVRAISLISGVGLMVVAVLMTWRWTGSAIAATVVVSLMAVDEQFVFYASEARPYALLQLLSVVQVVLFWPMLDRKVVSGRNGDRQRRVGFAPNWLLAAVSAMLIYVHYTAVWLFLVELIFVPVWILLARKSEFANGSRSVGDLCSRLISTGLITVVACVPAGMQMQGVFQRRRNWELVSSWGGVLQNQREPFLLMIVLPVVCLALFLLVSAWRRPEHGKIEKRQGFVSVWPVAHTSAVGKLVFVLLWAIVPTICVVVLAYLEIAPMALKRYTMVGSAAFPIFAGLAVALVSTTTKRLAVGILILGASLWQNPFLADGIRNWELPTLRVENWKSPIDEINASESRIEQPLFLFSNLIEDVEAIENQEVKFQRYLKFPVRGLYRVAEDRREIIPRPTMGLDHFIPEDLEKNQTLGWRVDIGPGRQQVGVEH